MMNAKIFSYKVVGVSLGPETDNLKVSQNFDRKTILDALKGVFKSENYKIDEASLSYKIKEDQLYIEGLAIENEEPKSIGFRFGS